MAVGKRNPRRQRKPRRRVARRVPRSLPNDMAKCVDNIGTMAVVPNTMYFFNNIALTNSARAKTIAQAFQYYRITKVEFRWKPLLDTFTSATNITVPNLYYRIDKSTTLPLGFATVNDLKRSGCKPSRLDDKNKLVSFAPAVHIGSDDGGAAGPATTVETAALMKVSPWITTNANAGSTTGGWQPNSVDHRGLVFYIEQSAIQAPPNNIVASLDIVVHYEFKKPSWQTQAPTFEGGYLVDLDNEEGPKPELIEEPL